MYWCKVTLLKRFERTPSPLPSHFLVFNTARFSDFMKCYRLVGKEAMEKRKRTCETNRFESPYLRRTHEGAGHKIIYRELLGIVALLID